MKKKKKLYSIIVKSAPFLNSDVTYCSQKNPVFALDQKSFKLLGES